MTNTQPLKVSVDTPEFQSWFAGAVKINHDYMNASFPSLKKDEFAHNNGQRYIRVTRGGSAHAFIDRVNGDVLKPATFRAPAKHARGNLFDSQNGLGMMGEYGPAYLR